MPTWAEYPKRQCRIPVQIEPMAYLCEVPEHHPGPCASPSVAESVRMRDIWEEANPGWEKLSTFDDPFAEVKP